MVFGPALFGRIEVVKVSQSGLVLLLLKFLSIQLPGVLVSASRKQS